MKRIISIFLTLSMALGLLTGCKPAQGSSSSEINTESKNAAEGELAPNNPTKVTFYSYSLSYPTMKAGMEHLIQSFNDGIGKEKGVVVEGVIDETNGSLAQSDIAAGQQVDVVQHVFATLDNSKVNLGFDAYEDIFPKEELEKHFSTMYPNALDLGVIDGKTYGLAFTFSTPILYINGKLFEEAGLNPEVPPKTWEEVMECSKQIKEKTGTDGFGLAPNNGWTSYGLMYSNNGEVLSEDRKEVLFADEKSVEAYEMWQEFYNSGTHAVGTDSEVMEQFMAGDLGMNLQSTSLLSGYRDAAESGGWELYGSEMPGFGELPSVPVNSGSALAVKSDSPTKSAAIWEFIKYATGPEGYTIITEEIGYLPLQMNIEKDSKYLKDFVDNNPIIQTNLNQLSRMRPTPIWPGEVAQDCNTIFNDATVKAITTNGDVKEILQEAEDQVKQIDYK